MLDTTPVARAQPQPLFPASLVVLVPTELHLELSPLLVSTVVLVRTVSRLQPALSRPVLRARLEPTALLLASQPRSRTLLETFATPLVFIESILSSKTHDKASTLSESERGLTAA